MQLRTNCTQARSVTGNNCGKWHLLYHLLLYYNVYMHPLLKKKNVAEQQVGRLSVGNAQAATVLVSWYEQEGGEIAFSSGTTEHGYGGEDSVM